MTTSCKISSISPERIGEGSMLRAIPVSVFYCHLVADLVHDFHERGLPLPQVQVIRPWFL